MGTLIRFKVYIPLFKGFWSLWGSSGTSSKEGARNRAATLHPAERPRKRYFSGLPATFLPGLNIAETLHFETKGFLG